MKLVIAEDEKWVRTTIIDSIPFDDLNLSLIGEASNGLEALEICKSTSPDILLTDIRMPGLNGIELIEILKEIKPAIKIVIVSGYSDFEYAKAAMKFGVRHYLTKPVDEEEIFNVLSDIISEITNERKNIFKNYHSSITTDSSQIESAKKIIEKKFSEALSLEHISREVRLSPSYFSELFKKETGMSFIEYKIYMKIEKAKELLLSTNLRAYEICDYVGYNDAKYFSKLFKKITGLTLTEFRDKNKL